MTINEEQPTAHTFPGRLPTVAMLGGGNMNGAILEGLLAADLRPEAPIRVTTRSSASAEKQGAREHVEAFAVEADPEVNRRAVKGAGLVFLGVKPYAIAELLDEIRDALEPGTVIVSVAAGITTAAIEARLTEGIRVIRSMPNTPATIGLGVTGIAAGATADDEALALAVAAFECVGEAVVVDESLINAVGAASGSGPAHLYLFAEALMAASIAEGLDEAQARTLIVGTLRGAAEMLHKNPDLDASELRRRVTSPNGTTERSVAVFQDADLEGIAKRAFRANILRSEALAGDK